MRGPGLRGQECLSRSKIDLAKARNRDHVVGAVAVDLGHSLVVGMLDV